MICGMATSRFCMHGNQTRIPATPVKESWNPGSNSARGSTTSKHKATVASRLSAETRRLRAMSMATTETIRNARLVAQAWPVNTR